MSEVSLADSVRAGQYTQFVTMIPEPLHGSQKAVSAPELATGIDLQLIDLKPLEQSKSTGKCYWKSINGGENGMATGDYGPILTPASSQNTSLYDEIFEPAVLYDDVPVESNVGINNVAFEVEESTAEDAVEAIESTTEDAVEAIESTAEDDVKVEVTTEDVVVTEPESPPGSVGAVGISNLGFEEDGNQSVHAVSVESVDGDNSHVSTIIPATAGSAPKRPNLLAVMKKAKFEYSFVRYMLFFAWKILKAVEKDSSSDGILAFVSSVMIIYGFEFLIDCPAKTLVPVYMIQAGFFGLLSTVLHVIIRGSNYVCNSGKRNDWIVTVRMARLVFFAWFLAGCYWVYSIYPPDYKTSENPNYCSYCLYRLSFILVTTGLSLLISYMFLLLMAAIFYWSHRKVEEADLVQWKSTRF